MALDASIFGALGVRPKSAADYAAEDAANQQNMLNLQMGRQRLNAYEQDQAEKQSLRNLLSGQTIDLSNPADQAKLYSAAPTMAPGILKTHQEGLTSRAKAAQDQSVANKNDFETQVAKANQAITDISSLNTPEDAIAGLRAHLAKGDIDELKYKSVLSTLQPSLQDPAQFGQWKRQMVLNIMDAKDRIAATAQKVVMSNAGGSLVPVNENADAGPVGAIAGAQAIKTTATPGEVLQAQTSRQNNAATIAAENARSGATLAETARHNQAVEAGKTAKDIPQAVVTAYVGNQAALQKIDDALAAVEANPDAFGLSNVLGDTIKQRTDPQGVQPRAIVSDIGSLKIHDRTGAAMSVGESARLKPFIPNATDTAETIRTKLLNLRNEYIDKNTGVEGYYTPDMGFKPLPAPPKRSGAAPAPSAPSGFKITHIDGQAQ